MYPIDSTMVAITMMVGINSLLSFSRIRLTIIPMMVPAKAQKIHPIIEENLVQIYLKHRTECPQVLINPQ